MGWSPAIRQRSEFERVKGGLTRTRWARWTLVAFLSLLVYDGAIRKWLVPAAEQLVFVAKDLLLLGALFVWVLWRGHEPEARLHPWVRLLFALYCYWVLVRVFSFSQPNLAVGLWGLKSHLLYASVLLFLPLAFSNLEELFSVLERVFPWLVIPVCALAFVQVLAPADSILNQQVRGGEEGIAFFGDAGLVRVTGTFSYISGMAGFVQATCLLGIGLYLAGVRSRAFLIGLAFALAALPVTGSRTVVAVTVVAAAVMLVAAKVSGAIPMKTVVRVVSVMLLLGAISLHTQSSVWEAFSQRAEAARDDESRTITAFTNAFEYMQTAGLTGFGTGTANLGAPALAGDIVPFSWLPFGDAFEEESGRIVIEIGIIGWALSLALRIGLLVWAGALALTGGTRTVRAVGVLALPVMALSVQQGNGVFAVPIWSAYFWFCVALMALARLEDLRVTAVRMQKRRQQWPRAIQR